MSENDNDFMGSSFSNYDVTENRMSDSTNNATGGGGNGQHSEKDYSTAKTSHVVIGLIWCIICLVIAVSNNGRAGNPDNPGIELIAALAGVGGLILIPFGKGMIEGRKARREFNKAVGGFQNAVHTCRLRELMDFIEEERDTDLGRRLRRLFDHIDKTDFAQVNRIWRETPAGKKEMEELDKFNETHPN